MEEAEIEDDALPEFTLAEIMEMESAYREKGEESLTQKFCQELATNFSGSVHRIGKPAIDWEQVQYWFQDKQKKVAAKITSSRADIEEFVASDATMPKHLVKCSSAISLKDIVHFSETQSTISETDICQKPKAQRVAELSELVFEALSSKDSAWFDVAAFLNFRVLCTGELEVRVRFAGFGHDEDEWVNVRRGLRERSIPLEPSECHKVQVGDLVLAYRANEDHALYSDANVVEIQRRMHDNSACRCIFVVCFQYDSKEGHLQLSEICCRPI